MDQLIAGGAAAPIDVTMDNFMAEVIEASATTPTIVQFWAPWCGPCKQLGPAIEKLVRAAQGAVKLVKLNVDENPSVTTRFRVTSIPSILFFKDGELVDKVIGAVPRPHLEEKVLQHL